jgi:cell division transport system permease protein
MSLEKEERRERKRRLKTLTKTRRSKFLDFGRIIRYGFKGFSRNLWLTFAAISVMTITLIILSITVLSKMVLTDTVDNIKDGIEISVYLKNGVKEDRVMEVSGEIEALDSVVWSTVKSPEQAKSEEIQKMLDKGASADLITAAKEAPNFFPWILNVKMLNLSNLSELDSYLDRSEVKELLDDREFSGDKRDRIATIDKIVKTTGFIEQAGIILGLIFAFIAALIIYNTIRMAIFSRQEEIYMMKLIGAGKGFIRGPFLVEAVIYGVIAAVISVGLVGGVLYFLEGPLAGYGVAVGPTLVLLREYFWFAVGGLVVIGGMIGLISALFALGRYSSTVK